MATVDQCELESEFEALLHQQGVLAFLDKTAFDGLWIWNLENPQEEWVSPGFWRVLGIEPACRPIDWRDHLYPEDKALFLEAFERHTNTASGPFDQVFRFHNATGGTVVMRCRGQVVRKDGRAVRMLGALTVLRDAETLAHDRRLGELLEMSGDAVFAWSLRDGVQRWNQGAASLFGFSSLAAQGRDPNSLTQAVYSQDWLEVQARLEAGRPWSGKIERRRADGSTIYTSARLSPVEVGGGDVLILQIDRDRTAEHEANERLRLVNRELNHRVKNIFAVIQGLVSLSSQGEHDAERVTNKIQERIAALAAAHLISIDDEDARTISFQRVLEAVLAPYDQRQDQLIMRGLEASLPRRAVTPVGMILHELATNAVKYGAWSEPGGKLAVTWMADDSGDDTLLHVRWVETFKRSSAGAPDGNTGLGLPLIEQSARQLDGELRREWSSEGMETVLSFSLQEKIGGRTKAAHRRVPSAQPLVSTNVN